MIGAFGLEEGKRRSADLNDKREEGLQYGIAGGYTTEALRQHLAGEAQVPAGEAQGGIEPASAPSPASTSKQRAIERILRERRQDPMQAALDTGGYGVKPVNFSQATLDDGSLAASLRARTLAGSQLAGDYQTEPALLSRAEVRAMAGYLRGASSAQQQAVLKALVEGPGSDAMTQSALQALSDEEPVLALAGWHMGNESRAPEGDGTAQEVQQGGWANTGKTNVPDMMLEGYRLMHPAPDQKGKDSVAMPPDRVLWAFFAGLDEGASGDMQAMCFEGAKACYASLAAHENDHSGKFDPERMAEAVFYANSGSASPEQVSRFVSYSISTGDDAPLPPQKYVNEAGAANPRRTPATEAALQASTKEGQELAAKEQPLLNEIAQLHKDAETNGTPVDGKREAELLAQLKPIQRASRTWNAQRLDLLWDVYQNQGGITPDEESEMRQRQAISVQPAMGAIQFGPPGRGRTAKPNAGQPDLENQSPVKMQVNSGDGGGDQKRQPNPKKAQRIAENEANKQKKEDTNRKKHEETLPPDLSGINLGELKVSTKLDVGENSYFGVNQRARAERGSGPTAIADWVKEKLGKLSPAQRQRGLPNGDKYDAHAEIHALQQVIESGAGKGQHAKMVVNGEEVCQKCKVDIPVAAEKAGFASLTIVDKTLGKTFIWEPGMTRIQEVKQ